MYPKLEKNCIIKLIKIIAQPTTFGVRIASESWKLQDTIIIHSVMHWSYTRRVQSTVGSTGRRIAQLSILSGSVKWGATVNIRDARCRLGMTFFLLVSRLTTGVIVKPSNLHSHFIRELEVGILFARSVGGYSKVKSRLAQESIAARGCEVSYFAFNVCILEKAFTITLMYGGVVMKQYYHFATILLDANTPPVVENANDPSSHCPAHANYHLWRA